MNKSVVNQIKELSRFNPGISYTIDEKADRIAVKVAVSPSNYFELAIRPISERWTEIRTTMQPPITVKKSMEGKFYSFFNSEILNDPMVRLFFTGSHGVAHSQIVPEQFDIEDMFTGIRYFENRGIGCIKEILEGKNPNPVTKGASSDEEAYVPSDFDGGMVYV